MQRWEYGSQNLLPCSRISSDVGDRSTEREGVGGVQRSGDLRETCLTVQCVSNPTRKFIILSYLILSYLVLSYLILSY